MQRSWLIVSTNRVAVVCTTGILEINIVEQIINDMIGHYLHNCHNKLSDWPNFYSVLFFEFKLIGGFPGHFRSGQVEVRVMT